MKKFKSVKVYLFFAVLLFVAKPFLGFSIFSRSNPPETESIFVKAFTKRKQEYVEGSKFDIIAIQKKLADPVNQFLLGFSFLLSILFPFFSGSLVSINNRFIRRLKQSLSPSPDTWLLNGQLII